MDESPSISFLYGLLTGVLAETVAVLFGAVVLLGWWVATP